MQTLFPTQRMTDCQVYSGYEHIPTAKSDTGGYFLPASSIYWVSYLLERIQNCRLGP